jgi:hypothetical protein|tara:strand:- start:356 stop:1342 length:987 start_codon:yes stop_codon:yes gene_type:complete
MNRNLELEDKFYANTNFAFSYSSLNKLLFSPSLFYKDYILWDREVRADKHLVEGKLVHCLVFEPENLTKKFNIVPGKSPSDNIRKVMKDMSLHTDAETLEFCEFQALASLKTLNLFQSLKTDEQRLKKVINEDNEPYWEFLSNSAVDVINQETLIDCKLKAEVIKSNDEVMTLFKNEQTDFDLDPIKTYAEKYLKSDLEGYPFKLHGYVDYYIVDTEAKTVTICDLKTSGKTVDKFNESVDFYNYWLQAAIYSKMVYDSLGDDRDQYTITFKFIVIDKYNQVYVYDVSQESMSNWANGLGGVLKTAGYHYNERNYSLPYELLVKRVKL